MFFSWFSIGNPSGGRVLVFLVHGVLPVVTTYMKVVATFADGGGNVYMGRGSKFFRDCGNVNREWWRLLRGW